MAYIKSMIFITHELPLLYNVTDDIMVMYAGQIVEKGTAKEAVFDPLHPYAKGLMGSIIVPEKRPAGRQTDGHSRGAAQSKKPAAGLPVCRTLQISSGRNARCTSIGLRDAEWRRPRLPLYHVREEQEHQEGI